MNYAFRMVSFSCISEKTEENDDQVIGVKEKMIKLESMPNVILFLLKILYFVIMYLFLSTDKFSPAHIE